MAKLTTRQKMIFAAALSSDHTPIVDGSSPADYHPADETIFRVTTDGRLRITTDNRERVTGSSAT